jgi:hypothetical protein
MSSRLGLCLIALGAALGTAAGCRGTPNPLFTQLTEARALAADLHVQFVKASDASDRAVLADTDQESVAFAREAERATKGAGGAVEALAARLQTLGFQNESSLLQEFSGKFADYQKLDREVLALAVENTNLKAQRLSFGPVQEAADAFRDSLDAVAGAASTKNSCRTEALVARAELAVREIQVLQAPHIAEPDAAAMARLEAEMSRRETSAADATTTLAGLVAPKMKPTVAAAVAALAHFKELSAQLIALSRRNTNVRSLALSLRQKPALTAACEASLAALEGALAKETFGATR